MYQDIYVKLQYEIIVLHLK